MQNLKVAIAGLVILCMASSCRKDDVSIEQGPEVLGISVITGGKKVYDIIKPSSGDFWYNTNNFNSQFGLQPGDTVVLRSGRYGHIDITHINGITFINEGQVEINSFNLGNGATNIRVLGNGTPGIQYGIRIKGTNGYFATDWTATGDLEIGNVEVAGNNMGFKVTSVPGTAYPLSYQNLWIHDCLVQNTTQEAMYLGRDELGGPFITAKVERNIVRNAGRDGIQVRNGTFEIIDNVVDNVGVGNSYGHTHGILFGGNTKNGVCERNIVTNVNYGFALFINGYGTFSVQCNTFSSSGSAIFTKNFEKQEDLQGVGYQRFEVHNNTIGSATGRSVESYANANGISVALNATGNKTGNTFGVQSTVSFTQSNNGANVSPVCNTSGSSGSGSSSDQTSNNTNTSTSSSNQAPVISAGQDQTITLPTNSVTLTGSGSDPDGSIVAALWHKISGPDGAYIATPNVGQTTISNLVSGVYVFELAVADNAGAIGRDQVTITVNQSSSSSNQNSSGGALSGTVIGRVEAEAFTGMSGVAIGNIPGGGRGVGFINNGDWIDYAGTIPAAGNYQFRFRVASPTGQKSFQIRNGSGAVLAEVIVPQSNGWTITTANVTLAAGYQTVRLYSTSDEWDIDYFDLAIL